MRDIEDIQGSAFNDTLIGNRADNLIIGLDGDDYIDGDDGDDFLIGVSGNDEMNGGGGDDSLIAGTGDDIMAGGAGDDWLLGGEGNDHLRGGSGDDRLEAGDGDDIITSGSGNDIVDGGAGTDTVWYRWIVANEDHSIAPKLLSIANDADNGGNGFNYADEAEFKDIENQGFREQNISLWVDMQNGYSFNYFDMDVAEIQADFGLRRKIRLRMLKISQQIPL